MSTDRSRHGSKARHLRSDLACDQSALTLAVTEKREVSLRTVRLAVAKRLSVLTAAENMREFILYGYGSMCSLGVANTCAQFLIVSN